MYLMVDDYYKGIAQSEIGEITVRSVEVDSITLQPGAGGEDRPVHGPLLWAPGLNAV